METTSKYIFSPESKIAGSIIQHVPLELRWLDGKLQQKWVIVDHTIGHTYEDWRDVPNVSSPDSNR